MENQMNNILINIKRRHGNELENIAKKYLYNNNKLINIQERLYFLRECKKENLVPKFILQKGKCFESLERQNHPFTENVARTKNNLFKQFLRLELKICNFTLQEMNREVSNLFIFISQALDEEFLTQFVTARDINVDVIRSSKRIVLNRKLERLINQQHKVTFNYDKSNVINLTNIIIPEECLMVWSLGPKFSFPLEQKNVPVIDILAEVEKVLTIENTVDTNEKRTKVTDHITQHLQKTPIRSMDSFLLLKAHKCTRKFLKDHNQIIVTKSDKGNKTVILEKDLYQQKMTDLLNDTDTYDILLEDPTLKINKKCYKIIDTLKNNNLINNQTKLALKINSPIPPRIYGLPKIHKINIPLRPIVSTINSPAYFLSKFCCKILKPLTLKSKFNVKNSFVFKEITKNMCLGENEILGSLDVISLFTNVPLDISKEAISERWNELENECILTKEEFFSILDVCILDNNYFTYQGSFYKQKYGLAMGCPLSPILADIVLEKLFNDQLPKLDIQPTFIYKYVDDIILSTTEANIEKIQSLFNSFHGRLKFTVEKENNYTLPFLDIKLHRQNNRIVTEWYKKDVASDILLNYVSNHPYRMKVNVAHSFIRRVLHLTDAVFRKSAIVKIIKILKSNNYPYKLINKLITKTLFTYQKTKLKRRGETKYGTIPYVPVLSEKIIKTLKLNSDNLVIASKIISKSSDTFSKTKDKIPIEKKDGLIYKIPCKDCSACYVGETSKMKHQRINQHRGDIAHLRRQHSSQQCNYKTALVKHVKDYNHNFDFDNAITLEFEKDKSKRLFKEACHIWLARNPVNFKVDSKRLHGTYINLIKSYGT